MFLGWTGGGGPAPPRGGGGGGGGGGRAKDRLAQRPLRIGIVCYPTVRRPAESSRRRSGSSSRCGGMKFTSSVTSAPFWLPLDHPSVQFHTVDIGDPRAFQIHHDYTLPLSVKMAEVSRAHRLDILHVHYAVPHATAALLALSMLEPSERPRVVTTLHGTDTTLLGSHPAYGPAIRHALEQSDAVTAVSNFLEGETKAASPN